MKINLSFEDEKGNKLEININENYNSIDYKITSDNLDNPICLSSGVDERLFGNIRVNLFSFLHNEEQLQDVDLHDFIIEVAKKFE